MLNKPTISHLYHVVMQQANGYEADREIGYFLPHQLQEALECAKSHISSDDATILRMEPLGKYDMSQVKVLWYHDPTQCDRHTCDVCLHDQHVPLFHHNRTDCTYLGSIRDNVGRVCDLYVKPDLQGASDEYIARFSDEPYDFIAHTAEVCGFKVDGQERMGTFVAWQRWQERKDRAQISELMACA